MKNQFSCLAQDLRQIKITSVSDLFYLIFEPSIYVVVLYRVGRFLVLQRVPILRLIFCLVAFFLSKICELLGVALSPSTNIGPGLFFGHTGLIRINHQVIIGKNASIAHGVTIGTKGMGDKGVPIIGDNVFIGAGAKILGKIKIGHNVCIGANAVVVHDVPDNATAVGVPAKIIKK